MKQFLLIVVLAFIASTALQAQFIFVFLNKKTDAEKLSEEESKRIMAGHFGNMERLAKEGKLVAAGPFEGGGGIFILKTTSIDSAKAWIAPDTGIKANRWNVELLPFTTRVAGVCPVSPPYQMIMYSFVRYKINSAGKPSALTEAISAHDLHVTKLAKSPETISEGIFSANNGGIIISKTEIKKEDLDADPAVRTGIVEYEMKQLYIAKGSFCEK